MEVDLYIELNENEHAPVYIYIYKAVPLLINKFETLINASFFLNILRGKEIYHEKEAKSLSENLRVM